jgi:hypothetical protein
MRVAKIRRLQARRTAENLPMGGIDRGADSEPSLSSSAAGLPRNAADGGDAPDSPGRLESELRQVPLFLRRRRL